MKNTYVKSLQQSLNIFNEKSDNFNNVIEEVYKKFNSTGRIIFLATGQMGNLIMEEVKSFKYLFKIPDGKIKVIISGIEYDEIDNSLQRSFENVDSIGTLSAIENNVSSKDVIVAFSATGKTNYVNAFLKESKDKGAFTSIVNSSKNKLNFDYVDEDINIAFDNKFINGLYSGNNITILKIAFEVIIFSSFEKIGQIYNNNIMTTNIWTEKLKGISIETIKKYKKNITSEEISKFIKITNGELSLILTMIKLNIDLESAKKIVLKNNYNFKIIFKK